jgi:nanoRNase/pAp phosphatase (c-di-AMP/oligoRNAs hydrolase)
MGKHVGDGRLSSTRKKIALLKKSVDPGRPLWILMQNDPDPDAIASAMALREVLGLKAAAAPMVTLKQVSRNENISMINLLRVKVAQVEIRDVFRAPQIAILDAQPNLFPNLPDIVRVIIDHHPIRGGYRGAFVDIRPDYGATSAILTEYLEAEVAKISPRLATALYYAIKTDTLMHGRDVTEAGFRAFSKLWPLANHQMISQMERPRMASHEVDVFIRALKAHFIERKCLFAELGRVQKEDLVPRIADFVLQIGDPEFAVAWGIFGSNVTFAARSLDPAIDSGAVLRGAFGRLGAAGGHKVMARATISLSVFRKEFGLGSSGKSAMKKLILKEISAQKKGGRVRAYVA